MRQIGVKPRPTAVAATIKSRDRVVILGRGLSIDAQVPFAAEFDRGAAHVDADALETARAQPPQLARSESGGGNGRLRGGTHAKRGRQHRLVPREIDGGERRLQMPGSAPDVAQNVFWGGRGHGGNPSALHDRMLPAQSIFSPSAPTIGLHAPPRFPCSVGKRADSSRHAARRCRKPAIADSPRRRAARDSLSRSGR